MWIVMAELATDDANRRKLADGETRVTQEMVDRLEATIDDVVGRFDAPTEFVVPGDSEIGAQLDLARTVVRRAERAAVGVGDDDSLAVAYLNRLSDTLWALARWAEGESTPARG